jgi:hypothetical protein
MRSDYNITPPPSAERLADGVVQSLNVVLAGQGALFWACWRALARIRCASRR